MEKNKNIYTQKDIEEKCINMSWCPILKLEELGCDKCWESKLEGELGQLKFTGICKMGDDTRIYYEHKCTICDHVIYVEDLCYPRLAMITYGPEGEIKNDIREYLREFNI